MALEVPGPEVVVVVNRVEEHGVGSGLDEDPRVVLFVGPDVLVPQMLVAIAPEPGEMEVLHDQQAAGNQVDEQGITCGVVAPMGDVVNDAQLIANGVVIPTDDPGDDYRWTINSPIFVAEESKRAPSRAPGVGDHSVEVLREAGYSEDEIQKLLERGIVIGPNT